MILTLLIVFLISLYLYVRQRFQYFEKHGIPYEPGYFPLGSIDTWKLFTGKTNVFKVADEVAKRHPGKKLVGYYGPFGKPILVFRNLDLMRRVIVKDFNHFTDRNMNVDNINPKNNKHFCNAMTVLRGDKWRSAREMISPTFSSGQLKAVQIHIQGSATDLLQYIDTLDTKQVDVKSLMNRYTAEVLGRVGCGILPQALTKPENNTYYQQVSILTGGGEPNVGIMLRFMFFMIPYLPYWLNLSLMDKSAMDWIDSVIRNSMRSRTDGIKRFDFIEMMIEAIKSFEKGKKGKSFTSDEIEDIVISNAILLFFAGNDTTASAISFILYFLAKNPDVQEKLYQEVSDTIDDNDGNINLNYDQLFGMTFMDKVIKEGLRLWAFNFMDRICVKDYFLEEFKFVIPKGMVVQSSVDAIYDDPDIYANPKEFDPENNFEDTSLFSPTFFAFGQGPRACLGMRFALSMIRTALVHILAQYELVPNEKTVKDHSKRNALDSSLLPYGGIHLTFMKRNK